jgi:hypothetical protein
MQLHQHLVAILIISGKSRHIAQRVSLFDTQFNCPLKCMNFFFELRVLIHRVSYQNFKLDCFFNNCVANVYLLEQLALQLPEKLTSLDKLSTADQT